MQARGVGAEKTPDEEIILFLPKLLNCLTLLVMGVGYYDHDHDAA